MRRFRLHSPVFMISVSLTFTVNNVLAAVILHHAWVIIVICIVVLLVVLLPGGLEVVTLLLLHHGHLLDILGLSDLEPGHSSAAAA